MGVQQRAFGHGEAPPDPPRAGRGTEGLRSCELPSPTCSLALCRFRSTLGICFQAEHPRQFAQESFLLGKRNDVGPGLQHPTSLTGGSSLGWVLAGAKTTSRRPRKRHFAARQSPLESHYPAQGPQEVSGLLSTLEHEGPDTCLSRLPGRVDLQSRPSQGPSHRDPAPGPAPGPAPRHGFSRGPVARGRSVPRPSLGPAGTPWPRAADARTPANTRRRSADWRQISPTAPRRGRVFGRRLARRASPRRAPPGSNSLGRPDSVVPGRLPRTARPGPAALALLGNAGRLGRPEQAPQLHLPLKGGLGQ